MADGQGASRASRMLSASRPIIDFLNQLKGETEDYETAREQGETMDRPLDRAVKRSRTSSVSDHDRRVAEVRSADAGEPRGDTMRALLVVLVAAAVFGIGVLFADDPRPGDPFDASPPPRPIEQIIEYLEADLAPR